MSTDDASAAASPPPPQPTDTNDSHPAPAPEPATAGMHTDVPAPDTPSAPAPPADVDNDGDVEVKDAPPAAVEGESTAESGTAEQQQNGDAATKEEDVKPEVKDEPASSPAKKRPTEEEEEAARAEKKRRLETVKKESKARGNRMFGVMLGTLKRAKAQVGDIKQTDAGRKRAEIEEKLQVKLGAERRKAKEKEEREREARDLKVEIQRKEEEISVQETIYRTRHNAKLDLAGFLCTTFTLPPAPSSSFPLVDSLPPAFLPKLPHAMSLRDPRASRPIYYLPRRLLPSQEDRIEDQIDAVKSAMRKERDSWEETKRALKDEADQARRKMEGRYEEMEREEREERQRRRREEEDREDREREERDRRARTQTREPSVAGMAVDREGDDRERRRSPSPRRSEAGDVAMRESPSVELSVNGAAAKAAVRAAEEDLEY
ncbi:hypothetical protein JCM8097_004278 [Rhodosporidiobolus ruineniae]